jgi:hypothetical protein
LQKLIDNYKDQPNVQFLTLNMDENPGLITPFLTDHHLSMIVLPASSYVSDTLNVYGIPQNWILDSQGVVRLKGIGYDSTEKWEEGMTNAIERIKAETAGSGSGKSDVNPMRQ